jgi:peptide/nickel transport system ATP-binding protein
MATGEPKTNDSAPLLSVDGLQVGFSKDGEVEPVLRGVDLSVAPGEILGVVGESGCGKTVFSLSLLGLLPPAGRVKAGRVLWNGRNLLGLQESELRAVRGGQIAMIFQNPQMALNPVFSVGKQIAAVLRLHRSLDRREAKIEAVRLLETVGFPDPTRRFHDLPQELSGGLCQRAMIAMALGCRPSLLIADEPTSSLDVTIQAQIIELLLDLRRVHNMAILLISHDLGVVAQACDRVAVMYEGRIVENASASALYARPTHPYTQLLLDSVPIPDPSLRRDATRNRAAGRRKKLGPDPV